MSRLVITRTILVLATLLLLGSCGIKTVYHNLDWVLSGMVNDYVDLTSEQETDVDKRIKLLLKWHQTTQLKLYAEDMRKIKQYTAAGLSDANAEELFNTFMGRWNSLKQKVAPQMADLLLELNEKQIKDLFVTIDEKNQEMNEDFNDMTPAERIEKAQDKLVENFERWLGDLNDSQIAELKTWPAKFTPLHEERMQFRNKWQAALKEVLTSSMSEAEKRTRLVDIISRPEQFQSETYKQQLVGNTKQVKALILNFDPSVTAQQKKYLAERLDYFISNFEELAAEKVD